MVKGDIFTSPIDFALQETMKKFENSDDDNEKLLYEMLKRSKAIWDNITINGLGIIGMTYEQFCEQFEHKKNIVFLTDDEVVKFNKAVCIMEVLD